LNKKWVRLRLEHVRIILYPVISVKSFLICAGKSFGEKVDADGGVYGKYQTLLPLSFALFGDYMT
jgi:hypothetical protein